MNSRIVVAFAAVGLIAAAVFYFRPSLPYAPVPSSPEAEATGMPAAPGDGASENAADENAVGEDGVDIRRMMNDLTALAHDSMAGRGVGTPGSARARTFLLRRLGEIDLEPVGSGFEHPFTYDGDSQGVNLVARIPGSGSGDGVVVLTAHYDHLGTQDGVVFNGADDNASGTVAVLEIARAIAEEPLSRTLVIALLDAEEDGLEGARAFVSAPVVPVEGIHLDINLDMVARSGGLLWAGGAHHTPALRPILERVAATAPTTLRLGHDRPNAPEGDDWTNSSDHGPFHEAGIPFVYFGVEDHPDYHRATDDVENVVPAEYLSSVQTILSAIRALDAALPLPPTP